ncbi:MAG: DNA mismatch repair protein MutS [Limisphaerales bacterium]
MMAQYRRIKESLPKDALLLFRLGDFYELFFDDAERGASILNLVLTRRQDVPMCGLPYHAAQGYIARLLKAGHKVAVCDQTEDAKPGKLVHRAVTQILSPGAHFDERLLAQEENNYLAGVSRSGRKFGLALIELTTGAFRVTEIEGEAALLAELDRVRPAELVFPEGDASLAERLNGVTCPAQGYDALAFETGAAEQALREHFGVGTLDGFGMAGRTLGIGASGGVVHYLKEHLRRDLANITSMAFYETGRFLRVDAASLRNLEVLEPLHRDAPGARSLLTAWQRTVTPMGARLLRDWLSQPLAERDAILRRQAAVSAALAQPSRLDALRAALREVRDLERTLGRLGAGSGNARDLVALRFGLEQVPRLADLARELDVVEADGAGDGGVSAAGSSDGDTSLLLELASALSPEPDLVELIARAIVDEPPALLRDGGMIREGYSAELDGLLAARRDGQDWIARLQQEEIERTGIPSLKIRFNSVFGYYIEVTKANLDRVPPEYVRKQTVAGGERFITPALKEMEGRILGAEERSAKLEALLFQEVREAVLARLKSIQATARSLAQLDVLGSFAEGARQGGYVRPEMSEDGRLWVEDGRHPVLDGMPGADAFVPNDTDLDVAGAQIALITGPNMAGKSTYIRQVALLVLLAHAGSFVPAKAARIGMVDRLFTRIGASDNLARGQSTFMVEMSETANILNHASRRSLVILDEIGRGTSTFDGLSLAWSIVEHLHNVVGARTLFATHYHELTELAVRLARVRNFNVAVREWNDQIVFLRKIVPGGTDKSYGIQVARLAGVPRPVIERAKYILRVLEEAELDLQRLEGGRPDDDDGSGASTEAAAKRAGDEAGAAGSPSGAPTEDGPETTASKAPRGPRQRTEREKLRRLEPTRQLDLFR